MLRPIAHSKRVLKRVLLAWLIATSCAAHAGEATESAVTAPAYPKLTAGAVLMSDYIYRGISSHKASRNIGKRHNACTSSTMRPISPDC